MCLHLWSCWLQRNECVKSVSPPEEQLKRCTSGCWAALQIDFWMLSGLIFHLHCYNLMLLSLWKPRSAREEIFFVAFPIQKVQRAPAAPQTSPQPSTFTLILLAARRLRAWMAFSSPAQEKYSSTKRGAAFQRPQDSVGNKQLFLYCSFVSRWGRGDVLNASHLYVCSIYKNIYIHLKVVSRSLFKHALS